jgi:hypothetical protein
MPSKLKLLGIIVAVAAGVAAFAVWPNQSQINPENAAKVHEGLTLEEVEAILGGPARDDSTGPLTIAKSEDDAVGQSHLELTRDIWVTLGLMTQNSSWVHREWVSNTTLVQVAFIDGRALVPRCFAVRRVREAPWVMVRRWMGW